MENQAPTITETREIVLRLEQYDDIFSDFDMRPYSKRSLSVDFLDEIRRAARDKNSDGIELILHAPTSERDETKEATIRERLKAHFNRHHQLLSDEKRRLMKFSISMVVMGVISMAGATFIMVEDNSKSLLMSFLLIFLEPAAWFLLWEGMEQIMFNSKNINPELDFYRKMSDSRGHIDFRSY